MTPGPAAPPVVSTRPAPVDYAGLAATLAAISYPVRLELLDMLRVPHTLPDIRLSPHRHIPGTNPARVVSKQAVHAHLDKLVDAGLVDIENLTQAGRRVNRYSVNLAQFWSASESLRRLATRYAVRSAAHQETGTMAVPSSQAEESGPRLVLVHGAYEGRTYPLDPPPAAGHWVIGRSRGADILLDYDRFVSGEHARVVPTPAGFLLEDRGKNGTRVNWVALPRGGRRLLRAGDIVGVGQTTLVMAL